MVTTERNAPYSKCYYCAIYNKPRRLSGLGDTESRLRCHPEGLVFSAKSTILIARGSGEYDRSAFTGIISNLIKLSHHGSLVPQIASGFGSPAQKLWTSERRKRVGDASPWLLAQRNPSVKYGRKYGDHYVCTAGSWQIGLSARTGSNPDREKKKKKSSRRSWSIVHVHVAFVRGPWSSMI